nr:MAG TPA: hypothetical protein [Caudoviricetes sp.]
MSDTKRRITKMKVYKSRIMGLISRNAVKARKFKRGTID